MILDYIEKQIGWSRKTFGPGKWTIGIIKHIKKELREIQREPDNLEEWIDVVILGLDGAWRAGYTPEQIVDMLKHKQAKNFLREWPPPLSEDLPMEHIKKR